MEKDPIDVTSQLRVVFMTVPDVDSGRAMARRVVGEKLAACCNVIPGLTSVYRWDGELREDSEALLVLKTTEEALSALERRIMELHPYEVPEFLALPVADGHAPYLRWVVGEVMEPGMSQ